MSIATAESLSVKLLKKHTCIFIQLFEVVYVQGEYIKVRKVGKIVLIICETYQLNYISKLGL